MIGIKNILLGIMILFTLCIMAVPVYADSNIPCKDSHVPVERTNGKIVCLIKETAESTVERFGWSILSEHQAAIKHDESLAVSEDTVPTDNSLTIELHLDDTISVRNDSQTESPDTAHNVSEPILPKIPPKEPEQQDPNDPCYGITNSGYFYKAVEPIIHSITEGTFEKMCAQPHHKWFEIYLDTHTGGSVTLEIPKDVADLRQYDYLDCNDRSDYDLDGKNDYHTLKNFRVEQIAQTDHSRTLKFTYDEAISQITYFDAHAIVDGVEYSEPNDCIKEYDDNDHDPTDHLPRDKPTPAELLCPYHLTQPLNRHQIDLNYTITNGDVLKICTIRSGSYVDFYFSDVTFNSVLTVDIPWSVLHPDRALDFGTERFHGDTHAGYPVACQPPKELLFRNHEYQTFEIPIHPGGNLITVTYNTRNHVTVDLSIMLEAVVPFDRSKEHFVERCYCSIITGCSNFNLPECDPNAEPAPTEDLCVGFRRSAP